MIDDRDIKNVYREDTNGKRIAPHWTTPNGFDLRGADNKHGDVTTTKFNRLFSRKEFLKLSLQAKAYYVNFLRRRYNATNLEIAKAIGINNSTLGKMLKASGVKIEPSRGTGKLTPEESKRWEAFCGGIFNNVESVEERKEHETPVQRAEEERPVVINNSFTVANDKPRISRVKTMNFEQCGELNFDELINRIKAFFPEGTVCRVDIEISTEKEDLED